MVKLTGKLPKDSRKWLGNIFFSGLPAFSFVKFFRAKSAYNKYVFLYKSVFLIYLLLILIIYFAVVDIFSLKIHIR